VYVSFKSFAEFSAGMHAETAFPDLSPTERNTIAYRLCPKCFERIFGNE
jgi:hypothetical protein